MSSTFEKIDTNKIKLTFTVSADRFEEGLKHAYNANKGKLNLPGFRKGKAPRKVLEAQLGKEVFYDDAFNFVLPDAYEGALDELKLDVVSKPEIDVAEVSTETGVIFTAEVFLKPEVTIENYKGITYKKAEAEVTELEITEQLDKDLAKNSRIVSVTDRPVQYGDVVTIDFEGFVNDVAFEGGKGTDYDLEIGSHSFIDTFEDQLVDHNVGDDLDVLVTFPAEYQSEELRSKEALFKVEIKDIKVKELPELNDDFVQDISEFDTLDEYKESIKVKLLESKENESANKVSEEIINTLIGMAEIDVPNVMIETEIDNRVNEFKNNIARQGLSMDIYLQYMGTTVESMRESYRETAVSHVKGRLVLEAIAKKEAFDVTEEDIDAEVTRIAQVYNMDKEKLVSYLRQEDRENISMDIKIQKALDFVKANGVETA